MKAQETYTKFAKFYDAYTAQYADDIPFYLAALTGRKGPLIEVGCGSGRILKALIRAGHTVTGVDASESMLALAQEKLEQVAHGQSCTLILHDFSGAPLPQKYEAALVTFYTFNYIHPDQRLRLLNNLGRSLADGSLIILHLFYPDPLAHPDLAGKWQQKGCYRIDGEAVTLHDYRRMLDYNTEERIQRYIYGSGVNEEIQTERYYLSSAEISELLNAAGFDRVQATWDLQFEHLEPLVGQREMAGEFMVVAERRVSNGTGTHNSKVGVVH